MNDTKLQMALHYAALGIPVFPLHYINPEGYCSCGGPDVNSKCKPGKHPYGRLVPHGLTNASTDPQKVAEWFGGAPFNIGLCTGDVSGIFVLDRDDRDKGAESLANLEAQFGKLPDTLRQTTGNGVHYIFNLPSGLKIKNSAKELAPGLDIRGVGGYIVAAPSTHVNGRTYTWMLDGLPLREHILDAPAWLISQLEKSSASGTKRATNPATPTLSHQKQSGFNWPDQIRDGDGREDFILRAAGKLRSKGLNQETIERILLDYNQVRIIPPLDVEIVLDRARRYPNQKINIAANDEDWSDPQVLAESLPPVPTFPLKLLPKSIAAYVADVAERMCCPVDFPAIGAMVALSCAIGSRLHCKPYANGTWFVPAGAWGMVVSPPSAIKTPPLSEMLRPLHGMDRQAVDQYARAIEQYQIDKALYDQIVKQTIKNGSNVVNVAAPVEPRMTRHIVNDSTYEKLVEIAQGNPHGFLVWRDELIGWFHSLSKENQKEARGLYLTGWSGTESYATDRIGRGHLRADRVNISLLGTIQPNVLRQIVYDAVSGGAGDDGLVARFQFAVYPDQVREFTKVDRYPDRQAMQHYESLTSQLANLDPTTIGAMFCMDGTPYLAFDDDAQAIFDDWRQDLENRIRNPENEEHPAILAHLGKYRSLFPKLALVLHLADGKVGSIGKNAAIRAKYWIVYLEAHARRIYHTATNRALLCAVALGNKIKAGRLPDSFTRSDVLIKEWSNLRNAEEVSTALTVLRDMNWLSVIEDRSTGGRPAERYFVNPKVKRAA
jgi:putative DNA primase/helicase